MNIHTQEKIAKIMAAVPENKTLLLDFDRTLICGKVNGVDVTSMVAILRRENHLDEDYSKKAQELYNFYRPIEQDTTLTKKEVEDKMQEWWERHFNLKIEKGLNINHIKQSALSELIVLRKGVKETLQEASKKNIQVVILSAASIGYETIRLLLEREGAMSDNIQIISNKSVWGEHGEMIDYVKPLIHSKNKDLFLTPDMVKQNVILVGDGLHDAEMLKDSENNTPENEMKNIIRVGIYENENISETSQLEMYKNTFDIVMVNEEIDFAKVKDML